MVIYSGYLVMLLLVGMALIYELKGKALPSLIYFGGSAAGITLSLFRLLPDSWWVLVASAIATFSTLIVIYMVGERLYKGETMKITAMCGAFLGVFNIMTLVLFLSVLVIYGAIFKKNKRIRLTMPVLLCSIILVILFRYTMSGLL